MLTIRALKVTGSPGAASKTGAVTTNIDDLILAFKLFVVSERPEDERFTNPTLVKIIAVDSKGREVLPDATDGAFHTHSGTLYLRACMDDSCGDHETSNMTFHWFSTVPDMESQFTHTQKVAPGKHGSFPVYCVVNERDSFVHSGNVTTFFAGIDWKQVEVVFE